MAAAVCRPVPGPSRGPGSARGGRALAGLSVAACLAGSLSSLGPWTARPVAADTVALPLATVADVVVDAQHGHVFISGDSEVVVTDLTGQIVSTIPDEQGASDLLLSADGSTLYVALSGAGAVSQIDTTTLVETSRTDIDPATTPTHLALAGGTLWVGYGCGSQCGGLAWVDTTQAVSDHPVVTGRYHGAPALASASASATRLGVVDVGNPQGVTDLYDVSTLTPTLIASRSDVPTTVTAVAGMTADGSTLMVGGYNGVTSVRTTDLSTVSTYGSQGAVTSLSMSPDARHLAFGMTPLLQGEPNVLVYNVASTTADHTEKLGSPPATHVAFGGDSSHLYIASEYSLTITDGMNIDPAGMSIGLNASSIAVGGTLTATGRLTTVDGTSPSAQPVTLTRSGPDGLVTVGTTTTAADGSYTFADTPPMAGGYTYRATWSGDAAHAAATAAASVTVGSVPAPPAEPPAQVDHAIDLPMSDFGAMVVDEAHGHIFLSSPTSGVVVVCDLDGSVLRVIDGEPGASGLWLSDDSTSLYVALSSGQGISVIDTSSLTEVARWATAWNTPRVMTVAAVNGRVWFTAYGEQTQVVLSESGSLDPADPTAVSYYDSTAFPSSSLAFATSSALPGTLFAGTRDTDGTVVRLDQPQDPPTASATSGGDNGRGPIRDMVATPDGKQLLVASGAPYYIESLDTTSLQPSATQYDTGAYPVAVAVTSDGAYVAGGVTGPQSGSTVAVWASGSPLAIHTYSFGSVANAGLRFSGDGSRLFAVTPGSGGVTLHVAYAPTTVQSCNLGVGSIGVPSAGSPVTLSGTLTDVRGVATGGEAVHLSRTSSSGTTTALPDVTTGATGTFSFSDTPDSGGLTTYTGSVTVDGVQACTGSVSVDSQGRMARSITLTTSATPVPAGQGVTLTATVGLPTDQPATGTITFLDGATQIGGMALDATGRATLDYVPAAAGVHSITATYGGDQNHLAATSDVLAQDVQAAPTAVEVASSSNPSVPGQQVAFAAAVVTPPGAPTATGTVTFLDGGLAIGSASVDGDGIATLTTGGLSAGLHSIVASYSGDEFTAPATSTPEDQTVAAASPDLRFVDQLYNDILGRPADGGASTWASALDRGTTDRSSVASALVGSTEYITDQIEATYLAHLGRLADPQGLDYWLSSIRAGATYEDLEISFLGAPEYYANAGGTPDGFVTTLYNDVLGRDPDSAGRSYWDGRLASGTPPWVVAASLVLSTEAMSNRVTGDYEQLLGRAPDPAGLAYWTGLLQHGARDEALIVDLAGSTEYWEDTQAY